MSKIIKSDYVMYENLPSGENINGAVKSSPAQEDNMGMPDGMQAFRNDIIQETMEKAQRLYDLTIENAKERAAEMERIAYEEGHTKGLAEGREEGYAQGMALGAKAAESANQTLVDELKKMLEAVENEKDGILEKFKSKIVDLSIRIAEKIVKHDLNESSEAISSIIKSSIIDYKNVEWVKISVSDEVMADHIKADWELEDVLREVSENVKIEVLHDDERGSCVIEMPDEIIDAGINTQLKNMRNVFNVDDDV